MTAPLHIALIKDGEPLPQTCRPFYLRTGNLARVLASRGHYVTWHSSNFLHYQKELYPETGLLHLEEGYDLHLHSCGTYPRNISPQRWVHHARLARAVYRELMQAQHLDVIVCCVPTLESAWACSLVAKTRGVPLILDVRDPWPEVFVSAAPAGLRPLARAVLAPYFLLASRLYAGCTSLTAVSSSFLSWAQRLGRRKEREQDQVFYIGSSDLRAAQPPSGTVRCIYLGGFSTIYDFGPLAEFLERPESRELDLEIFLVGAGGGQYQRLRERLEGHPKVTFTGWMERAQAYELAHSCHLGLLPLTEKAGEFMPNKPFEYASLGLALLSSARGELEQLVSRYDFGWTYDRSSVDSLARQLQEIAGNPEKLSRRRERARTFWQQEGDCDVHAGRFADHVESVARR